MDERIQKESVASKQKRIKKRQNLWRRSCNSWFVKVLEELKASQKQAKVIYGEDHIKDWSKGIKELDQLLPKIVTKTLYQGYRPNPYSEPFYNKI